MGYPGIVVLMAVESSILPLPSELVMPPAGYLAAKGEMSFVVAVAFGVLGSVLGALANYGLARWLGRAFFLRLGKYVRSEEHTSELQSRGHLVCRLLLEKKKKPKIRYYADVPPTRAGLFEGRSR